ncbi:MAG: HEPN domain-containing protein [Ferruginibacter sp.]
MYYLLTENFKSNEAKLVTLIEKATPVEKIYLLCSTLATHRTESIFLTDAPSNRNVSHYWLLVLINKNCGHSETYVQDKIENNCRHFIPVTAIVFDIAKFNGFLVQGHRFACTVLKIAVLLSDNSNMPLATPRPIIYDHSKEEASLSQALNKVNEFLAGAELYCLRKQTKMAAFMLHQAAEHSLNAILKKGTGLHVNTHNIDKLIRYCSMINYKLRSIFPADGEENKKLIALLQKSYIDTRYNEDFTVSNLELITMTERVKLLQQMANGYMKDKEYEEVKNEISSNNI